MSKIISFISKKLANHGVVSTNEFDLELEQSFMTKKQKNRIDKFFLKTSPNRSFKKMRTKGYTDDQILSTSFGERFGKNIVMYRFKEVLGQLSIILMHVIQLLIINLTKIATITSGAFARTAEGGEVIFHKKFEIYSCEPKLCVDAII